MLAKLACDDICFLPLTYGERLTTPEPESCSQELLKKLRYMQSLPHKLFTIKCLIGLKGMVQMTLDKMSNKSLMKAYVEAKNLMLAPDFIDLLAKELKKEI
ncbi:sporulation histidine kinase inhibitor Sda [Fictibacillus enclensis]|uniref:sporulation histidine kinase inhibitor Sda n=1 Tax=Fictibacillus enclensis TaxID=1017270 RepID=UPI0025A0A492|nr:sporulation histidine kinase inhibitor Sda [Fictibacillus enclensis]MDM5196720.1 sporulation histidine kinase inhibitor Sda [Fictibacillus enclensis]